MGSAFYCSLARERLKNKEQCHKINHHQRDSFTAYWAQESAWNCTQGISFIFFDFQFIQELFPELQNAELTVQGLKLPSQPKNSLRLPLGQKKKPTVCSKFNESLIKLVVAMKRYAELAIYVRQ